MSKPDLLTGLTVARPCTASWDAMAGDDRVRFCGQCRLNVYNLSGMSRPEAEALMQRTEGRLCVRFYQRRDGTVLTRDCPLGVRRIGRGAARLMSALVAGVVLLLGFIFWPAARSGGASGSASLRNAEPFKTVFNLISPALAGGWVVGEAPPSRTAPRPPAGGGAPGIK